MRYPLLIPTTLPLSLLCIFITINLPSTHATPAPKIPGFTLTWSDTFSDPAGSPASPKTWQYETPATNQNLELQHYTSSPSNAHISKTSTLQITPLHTSETWTSARLSTHQTFHCAPNTQLHLQARIKLGNNPPTHQKGIWPAFWTLGSSFRENGLWPQCAEWDIMEQVNGVSTSTGTIHWGNSNTSSPQAIASQGIAYERAQWHEYALRISRVGNWEEQSISWVLDGEFYFVVTGEMVGDWAAWNSLVAESYYVLLNVAVGGDWPGEPDDWTLGGTGSGMEVAYVAVYEGLVGEGGGVEGGEGKIFFLEFL
ncbi:abd97e23-552c-4172-9433-67cdc457c175 [Sclerotinia trifoliorum]|uniref:Abd97e23-552c-4172-9433-67cdc457c175 n=1 Tax=Sclerotinia trifoliorum TaxID=28548 RepID=A0A8H2VST6_9HELO|nr:abd97e23-552c-4172-9433-67cdc457c175 [Sclerotinia trifoliorum]